MVCVSNKNKLFADCLYHLMCVPKWIQEHFSMQCFFFTKQMFRCSFFYFECKFIIIRVKFLFPPSSSHSNTQLSSRRQVSCAVHEAKFLMIMNGSSNVGVSTFARRVHLVANHPVYPKIYPTAES